MMISIQHISHRYQKIRALDDVSLEINKGEIFGFLGPNGGGKTTLFKILSTYMVPSDGGTIHLQDIDLIRKPNVVRKHLGVVFQSPSLDKKLTVIENLTHQGHLYRLSGHVLREAIDRLLEEVRLSDRKDDLVEKLSGGLQRRAEIAKALLHTPRVLLFDEPSTGLDPGVRRDIWDILQRLKSQGVTILLTTHLIEEAEKCDRVAILDQGKIVVLGKPDDLKATVEGDVIIETSHPERVVSKLKESFMSDISSIKISKPSLEDVFLKETGHRFQ